MGSVRAAQDNRSGLSGSPQTFRSPTAVIVWWVWVLFAVANFIDLAVQGRDHGALVAAGILLVATGVAYVCAQRPRILADQGGVTVVNPLRDHRAGWATVTEVDLADLVRVRCELGPGRTKAVHAWAVHYSRRRKMVAQVKASRQAAREAAGRPVFGLGSYGGGRLSGYGISSAGYGRSPAAAQTPAAEAYAERIVAVLNEYVTAARAELAYAAEARAETAAAETAAAETAAAETPAAAATGAAATGTGTAGAGTAAPGPATPAAPAGPAPAATPGTPQASWLEPLHSTWSRPALLSLLVPILLLLLAIFV
jgi:hypothetical protein